MEKERARTTSNSSPAWESGGGSMNLPATIYEENSGKVFEMQPQYIFLELQHLSERYEDVYGKLHYTISDVDSLRRENLLLVCEHLELLSLAEEQDTDITPSSFSIVDDLGSKLEHTNHEMERGISIRSVLPKSISIRSSGFIGARRQPPHGVNLGSSTRRRDRHRLRLLATPALQGDCGGEEGEVEVEAFSQGTTKTELCNKWDGMGCCPYAERCHFAHGIHELRPVIRHPRYKTQICRMLDAGCPYGHRCHFRHSSLP